MMEIEVKYEMAIKSDRGRSLLQDLKTSMTESKIKDKFNLESSRWSN